MEIGSRAGGIGGIVGGIEGKSGRIGDVVVRIGGRNR